MADTPRIANRHEASIAPVEGSGASAVGDRWRAAWMKAQSLYPSDIHGMPQPTWAVRGFADDGSAAWDRLTRLVPERKGPYSIYAHVPFCETRCPFCDCHATAMPRKSPDMARKYVRRFQREVEQWHALGGLSRRPVTTVHLGGGTPNALPPSEFEILARTLAGCFATEGQTEWAVETSSRCLDEEHIAHLAGLGFTRIHVGVQTLRPRLRTILGRRDLQATVLARIEACLGRGWVVSVDLLYGLPEQTVADLLADLQLLVEAGIHGVSLYRLNHGGHNHRFMLRHGLAARGSDRLYSDYLMFMEAAGMLAARGYTKNHFTHFAKEKDANLYSRHAIRGEDLLAIGATADGVFGDYYYRHGDLSDYLTDDREKPPLQGGGCFTSSELRARGLVTQLMSGEVLEDELDVEGTLFVQKLEGAGLLCRVDLSRSWRLTDAGSWFIEACTTDALRVYTTAAREEVVQ